MPTLEQLVAKASKSVDKRAKRFHKKINKVSKGGRR